MILAQTVLEVYDSEAVGGGFVNLFFNFDNCHPEVVSDVISGVAGHDVCMQLCANLVILGQPVLGIYDCLTLLQTTRTTTTTTPADGPYDNRAKHRVLPKT